MDQPQRRFPSSLTSHEPLRESAQWDEKSDVFLEYLSRKGSSLIYTWGVRTRRYLAKKVQF